jgi:hypothetical protein
MRKLLFSLLLISHIGLNGIINSEGMLNLYKQHFNSIEGWFYAPFIDILIKLDELQNTKQIKGNLAEVGVFHGKSFILLYLLSNPNERVLAVDCFDKQEFNYDNSGPGCKFESFIRNIKTFCDPELKKLEVLKVDSSAMTAKNYLEVCQNGMPFRIFSIDGSHRAKETEQDLINGVQALAKGGIVIIDDFFNYSWPGVSNGVSKFLLNNPDIKPFFIGFNKVLLAHKEFAEEYSNHLKKYFRPLREAIFFDVIVSIYE